MTTVHILLHGVALCGFQNGALPSEWPEGHRWIGYNVLAFSMPEGACLCGACSEVARRPEHQYED